MKKHVLYSLSLIVVAIINGMVVRRGVIGISMNFYYLPIILGIFFYEKKGLYLFIPTSIIYIATSFIFNGYTYKLFPLLSRVFFLNLIGCIVCFLFAQVKKKEYLLDSICEINADMMCTSSPEGRFINVNSAFTKTLGYSKEELVGSRFIDYVHPDDINKTIQASKKVQNKENVLDFINRYICKDGNYKYIEWRTFSNSGIHYSTARDITALTQQQLWLETALFSIGDGFIAIDTSGIIKIINKVGQSIVGYSNKELIDKSFDEVLVVYYSKSNEKIPVDLKKILENSDETIEDKDAYYITKDNERKELTIKRTAIKTKDGEVLGVAIIFRDVTEQILADKQIFELTYHDKLTGLYNRRYIEERLEGINQEDNLPLSIIIGDMNGLKLINDAFGHLSGDKGLIAVGEVMKSVSEKEYIVTRWGGDEYVMLMPKTTKERAKEIEELIIRACDQVFINNIKLSISLGHGTKIHKREDYLLIFKEADNMMYRRKLQQSEKIKENTINAIQETLYQMSDQEEGHSKEVANLCMSIAKAMNLPETMIRDIEVLGKIHDIGKIAIDKNILNKVDKLTLEECEDVKRHSETGFHIISSSPQLSYLGKDLLAHHENWDGSGYPNGLKGEDIPIMARILCIADAFEAMTSKRPYRNAQSKEYAINELKRCSGSQFDPVIVDAFLTKCI